MWQQQNIQNQSDIKNTTIFIYHEGSIMQEII